MTADDLLNRLDGVRRTGEGRWVACCPAHDDGSPSLAVREVDDGRLLLHCFAGCSAVEVVFALGLELSDLFPEEMVAHAKPERRPWRAADLIQLLDFESLIVFIAASDAIAERAMDDSMMDRLAIARARISSIAGALHGQLG